MSPKPIMNRPSTRIYKRQATPRQHSTSHQTLSGPPPRRSPRLQSRKQPQEPRNPPQNQFSQSQKGKPSESVEGRTGRLTQRYRLTKKNLKAFDKMARRSKKLAGEQPDSESSESSSLTKSVSTTDSQFPELADKNGINWGFKAKPPANLQFLQAQANKLRTTPPPTKSEYEDYAFALEYVENEAAVGGEASNLLKRYGGSTTGYRRGANLPQRDFPKNVGFNDGLSAARPDYIEGLGESKFDPFPVSKHLPAAVPYSARNAITLPHFAGEWKGPGKDMNLAQVQAAYDGAAMVYSREEARSFTGNHDPAGFARVFTFTSDGKSINTFANYSQETPNGGDEYHQYSITNTNITSSYEDFEKGRRQLRNLQDYAKETSEELRDELNRKYINDKAENPVTKRKTDNKRKANN